MYSSIRTRVRDSESVICSTRSVSRVRRPSRIRSRVSASVWPKNANRKPKFSSSQAAGPEEASTWANCSLPSAVSWYTMRARLPDRACAGSSPASEPVIQPRATSFFRHGYSEP